MGRRFILASVAIGALHYLLLWGAVTIYSGIRYAPGWMYQGTNAPFLERLSDGLISLLISPVALLPNHGMIHEEGLDGLIVLLAPSALWGGVGGALVTALWWVNRTWVNRKSSAAL